jgi:hypothetical protein
MARELLIFEAAGSGSGLDTLYFTKMRREVCKIIVRHYELIIGEWQNRDNGP